MVGQPFTGCGTGAGPQAASLQPSRLGLVGAAGEGAGGGGGSYCRGGRLRASRPDPHDAPAGLTSQWPAGRGRARRPGRASRREGRGLARPAWTRETGTVRDRPRGGRGSRRGRPRSPVPPALWRASLPTPLRTPQSRRRPGPGRTPAPRLGKNVRRPRRTSPWPSLLLAARRRSRRGWQLPRSRGPDAPSVQPSACQTPGERTVRRAVPPADFATVP